MADLRATLCRIRSALGNLRAVRRGRLKVVAWPPARHGGLLRLRRVWLRSPYPDARDRRGSRPMTSDLERALRARGAVLEAFHGLTLPAHFGDVGREWRAGLGGRWGVRGRLSLADRRHRRGPRVVPAGHADQRRQGAGAGAGHVRGVPHPAGQGRLRPARLRARAIACCSMSSPGGARRCRRRWSASSSPTTSSSSRATMQPLLGLEGPLARAVVGEALGVTELPRASVRPCARRRSKAPTSLVVAASEVERTGILRVRPAAASPRRCSTPAWRPARSRSACRRSNVLRVESGVPWAGVDMDETTLIMETGRDRGDQLHQGLLPRPGSGRARRGARPRQPPARRAWSSTATRCPRAAARLLADGHEVGYVTSAVRSQALAAPDRAGDGAAQTRGARASGWRSNGRHDGGDGVGAAVRGGHY